MHLGDRARRYTLLWWGTAVFILLLTACQPTVAESTTQQFAAVEQLAPTPTLQPALAQPVVEYSEPPPAAEMPSFSLARPEDEDNIMVQEDVVAATAVPVPSPTPTRILPTATPTPPNLRFTSPDEHYWFWRPVHEGQTNWTDKVYPYGGTRGGTLQPHHGVEFYVPEGTQILAVADGTVIYAGSDSEQVFGPQPNFYGNLVVIEHDTRLDGQPVFTLYGHLSEPQVVAGQHVLMQQQIALSGATGVAEGPHLHFEVRVGENNYSSTRNPRLWLYPFPDRGTVVGRVVTSSGEVWHELVVSLSSTDGTNLGHTTTTYAADTLNSDPLWNETFAIDDVGAGSYKAIVQIGEKRVTQEIVVRPYGTTFVELVIDPPPPTPEPTPEP
jgi:murein DD-endopeptidase MepM/ murein hydrolase activator NlpD